jgi:hypothetical protein
MHMLKSGGVVAVAVLFAGCVSGCEPTRPIQHEHKVVELDTSELTRVHLTMGAGELAVKGGATSLLEADFNYNVPAWKPSVAHHSTGTQSDLEISQGSEATVLGKTVNRWQLALNDSMPLEVMVHFDAGEARMRLGSLNLRNVELHMGAGEMEMDLRGKPVKSYRVEIHGGVGSATVYLPASVAISATASGGIGDINVSGLEKRNGRWINPRAESAAVTIELDVKGGVGEIRIVAE